MAFVAAMNQPVITKVGVNGSDVQTEEGQGDARVAFQTMLNRDLERSTIQKQVRTLLGGTLEQQCDLLVLTFQTRDIRGGKGERVLFTWMLGEILTQRPLWSTSLLPLVVEQGCWRDLWDLVEKFPKEEAIQKAVDVLVQKQFREDSEKVENVSLLGKWLPREGSKYGILAAHFSDLLFADIPEKENRRRAYRKECSRLNRIADTTEIKMCGRTWAEIEPKKVPGRLMKRCKKAFLNEPLKGRHNGYTDIQRQPGNSDRELCRIHFEEQAQDLASGKQVAKGAHVVMPHELVKEIHDSRQEKNSETTESLLQSQWNAIREEAAKGGALQRCVFLCDFSGSMSGTPMDVSLALGVLGSELAAPAFADHILTFDAKPTWHSFKGMKTLREKVTSVHSVGQGLNTNFEAACNLILNRLVEYKVPVEEAPTDLIVLTDMGFDAASTNRDRHVSTTAWQTHFDQIHHKFAMACYEVPRIVCWNLRAEFKDFHAKSSQKGVVELSGWSPSAFKVLQTKGIQVQTPQEGLRCVLDDTRYDPVRAIFETFDHCHW